MSSEQALFVASNDAIASDVDGEIMLINVVSGLYFGLDRVGSEIWRRLQQPTALGDLCTGLKEAFDGDPTVIEQETVAFVEKLTERKLVNQVQP